MPLLTLFFVRHLAIVGSSGHVATFDWQTGVLHAELQLQETCRDITYAILESVSSSIDKPYPHH
jgi:U3 small nucleolar RNA-associated protein 7